MSLLPTRDRESENRFLRSISQNPQEETITELIIEALEERRIQLAAQLVQLIPKGEAESPQLQRARHAAGFILVNDNNERNIEFFDICSAYTNKKRVQSIKNRMRPKSQFNRRRPR
jgi:hypothetical protein